VASKNAAKKVFLHRLCAALVQRSSAMKMAKKGQNALYVMKMIRDLKQIWNAVLSAVVEYIFGVVTETTELKFSAMSAVKILTLGPLGGNRIVKVNNYILLSTDNYIICRIGCKLL
jgi:hypothetical protein